MKNVNLLGLFDDHFQLEKLTKLGDPLQKLDNYIDWDIFKAPLVKAFADEAKDRPNLGRSPFNKLMLFKALLVQSLYNLPDDDHGQGKFQAFFGAKEE